MADDDLYNIKLKINPAIEKIPIIVKPALENTSTKATIQTQFFFEWYITQLPFTCSNLICLNKSINTPFPEPTFYCADCKNIDGKLTMFCSFNCLYSHNQTVEHGDISVQDRHSFFREIKSPDKGDPRSPWATLNCNKFQYTPTTSDIGHVIKIIVKCVYENKIYESEKLTNIVYNSIDTKNI